MQRNDQPMNSVEEPLAESAPIAREFASRLCYRDPDTGETCSWYHGLWQFLRLLKLVTTPEHHADFYREALGEIANGPGPYRVLVSGAADYSMLAYVLAAFRSQAKEPELTVNDLCETPLALSRWYSDRVGCRINTLRCDVLQLPEESQFDVVCTHSFLGRFPHEKRVQLVEKWRRVLRPGGKVVTVKRIRPGSSGEPTGFSSGEIQAFRDKVLNGAGALRASHAIDPLELAEEARIWASRRRTWPVRSSEEILELFENSGFKVDRLSCSPVRSSRSGLSGPSTLGGADYAQIVAIRL
jgi:SAM-dependent methyltransferase